MPRPITGVLSAEVARENAEFTHLLEFEFSTGTLRLNTGAHDLVTHPYAALFDGSVDKYFVRNPVQAPWPTTALCIEAWVRSDVGGGTRSIVSYAQQTTQFDEIKFGIDLNNNRIAFTINGAAPVFSSNDSVPTGEWHHVAVQWQSAAGVWLMYVDGVIVGSGAGLKSSYSIVAGGVLVIGQEQDSAGGGFFADEAWDGAIDGVRIYRRILFGTEIAAHFNGKFYDETLLVGAWHFDKPISQALINEGFESGSTGWTLVTGATIVNDGNARTGSWALKYATDGAGGPNVLNQRLLKVRPGEQVFMEAWMKGVGSSGTTTLGVRWRSETYALIGGRETVAGVAGPQASYVRVRGITNGAPAGAVYAEFDVGENASDNQATPWYIDDCFMSLSTGLDSGPMGNHLMPAGFTVVEEDTPLRKEWIAVGGLLRIDAVEEGSDSRGQGVDVELSGVDQTAIAILMGGTTYRGRRCSVWLAHLDSTTGLIVDEPLMILEGLQLSDYEIKEDRNHGGGTVTVKTRIRGRMGVERRNGIMSNVNSHQHFFPGDTFWQMTAQQKNSKIYWFLPVPVGVQVTQPPPEHRNDRR